MHRLTVRFVEPAARQHGVATTAQLLNAGVGRRSIVHALSGRTATQTAVPAHNLIVEIDGWELAVTLA